MRFRTLAAIALLPSLALAGCSDDSSESDSAATTTEASSRSEDSGSGSGSDSSGDARRDLLVDLLADSEDQMVTEDEAGCVADAVDLSDEAYTAIEQDEADDLSSFDEADRTALVAALDDCVDVDDLVARFGEQLVAQAGLPISDEEADCAARAFADGYDDAGQFIAAMTAMEEDEAGKTMFAALGDCMSEDSARAFLVEVFSGEGESDEVSQCVADTILDEMGVGPMLEGFAAGASGGSPELQTAMAAALADCGASGPTG